jgi:hypothetical protein
MTPARMWMCAIGGLLGGTIAAMVALAVMAHHGGSRVLPAYEAEAASAAPARTDAAR